MIPDSIVEEVRARADIVEIVGAQVQLRRAGKDYKALCPFHNEKTPSFHVVPSKGFYHCFGCGESGDVFTFVMKRGGLSFNEAVRLVGAKVGVDVPDSGAPRAEDEPHRALYEAVAFAADHFRQQLWDEPAGAAGRRYLERRGIARDVAERFGIGYAPDEWHLLRDHARQHGLEDEVLFEAGLIKASENAQEPYDRFRERLVFPVAEVSGRTVAFGARTIGRTAEGVPKYLNSPETPIYHKGALLYGLNWSKAAVRREGAALVVEGYMDYVSLAANGIAHAVAGMGTALTPDQANLLARYTGKVYLLYDSDSAGLRATFRSADALLRAGVHPVVVTLPAGEDPDSLVRKGGPAALAPLLESAVDVLERKLQMLEERGFFEGIEGSRRALDRLLPTLRATVDPSLRDIYVNRVALRTGVRTETLEQELTLAEAAYGGSPDVGRPRAPGRGRWSRDRIGGHGATGSLARNPEQHGAERLLLVLMLRDVARIPQAAGALDGDHFAEAINREVFEVLTSNPAVAAEAIPELELSEPARKRLEELRSDPVEITDGDRIFTETVAEIKVPWLFRRLDVLDAREAHADEEEKIGIVRERAAIKNQLSRLSSSFKTSRRYRWQASGASRRTDGTRTEED